MKIRTSIKDYLSTLLVGEHLILYPIRIKRLMESEWRLYGNDTVYSVDSLEAVTNYILEQCYPDVVLEERMEEALSD